MYQGFSAGPALPAVAIWFLSIKSCFNGTGVHLDLLYKPICKSVFKKNISALPVWLTQVNLKFHQEEVCLYRISSFWDLLKLSSLFFNAITLCSNDFTCCSSSLQVVFFGGHGTLICLEGCLKSRDGICEMSANKNARLFHKSGLQHYSNLETPLSCLFSTDLDWKLCALSFRKVCPSVSKLILI